jgi:murein DD-endopeptidase MepM/ murein hydrolase activator NlpD
MSALIWPLTSYTLSSPYGARSGGFHYGDDLAAPLGTPIYASGDGTVAAAGSASGFGDWIVIDHIINGTKVSTVYGHMYPSGLHVHAGQIVKQGDHIADVGANGEATGPHCHFEVWLGGRLTGGHAVDPATMVNGSASGTGLTVETVGNGLPNPADPIGSQLGTITGIWDFLKFILNPHNWWRVFLFLVGLAIVGYVIWSLINNGSAK